MAYGEYLGIQRRRRAYETCEKLRRVSEVPRPEDPRIGQPL